MTTTDRGLSVLATMVAEFDEEGAQALVRWRLEEGEDPMVLLDECRDGVKVVGKKYEEGQYYISALIMAGEVLRGVLEIIAPAMDRDDRAGAHGTMLICTVEGDIHDVGKEIAVTLLRAHRIEVVDLGVNVSPARVADAVAELDPGVVGLSGLLTEAFRSMQRTVAAVRERTADWERPVPIILGGTPMTQDVCDFTGADRWCTDAVEGARIVRELLAAT
jgi:methanogenic corrinoid protein MtbC1